MIPKRSVLKAIAVSSFVFFMRPWLRQGTAQSLLKEAGEAKPMKIYMASPLGFSEIGYSFYKDKLLPEIANHGYRPVDPWTLTDQTKIDAVKNMPYGPARREAWRRLNLEIGANNRAGIDGSDAIFAVLDGVDVDSGTASEIGYGFAKGKTILGYRGDTRLAGDNDGAIVNLQVEYFIIQSGGEIITHLADLPEALARISRAAPR